MQEENKQLKGEVKALQKLIEFENETYEKMKKWKRNDRRETKTRN